MMVQPSLEELLQRSYPLEYHADGTSVYIVNGDPFCDTTLTVKPDGSFVVNEAVRGRMVYGIGEMQGVYITDRAMHEYSVQRERERPAREYNALRTDCATVLDYPDEYGSWICGHDSCEHSAHNPGVGCEVIVDSDYDYGAIYCRCTGYTRPAPLMAIS